MYAPTLTALSCKSFGYVCQAIDALCHQHGYCPVKGARIATVRQVWAGYLPKTCPGCGYDVTMAIVNETVAMDAMEGADEAWDIVRQIAIEAEARYISYLHLKNNTTDGEGAQ